MVGGSFDPARADSAVVAEIAAAGIHTDTPHLVRHHLTLPDAAALQRASELLAQDGYRVVIEPAEAAAPSHGAGAGDTCPKVAGTTRVRASRTQPLTGQSLAQERTRMAGLAQRLGGSASGWDACAPQAVPPPQRPR